MSTIKVNSIKNTSTNDGGIAIDNSGHVQVDGVQLPTSGALSNRNLVINGAMRVAQRGTSSTSTGYLIDRYTVFFAEASITQSQQSLSSGSPYDEGFRYFHRSAVTSTSSANNAYLQLEHRIEAQNLAGSGWKYKDSSTNIIASFWARSSLAGTYYVQYRALDSASGLFHINKSFTLAADTWTKVEHVIPGHASLVFNDDTGVGLQITIVPHYGTDFTDSGVGVNSWFTHSGQNYLPDFTQNFTNTSSATFDVTGLQLEVGEKATPFEHRSYGDELARCQRYYYNHAEGNAKSYATASYYSSTLIAAHVHFPTTMRAAPTLEVESGTNYYRAWRNGTSDDFNNMTITRAHGNGAALDASGTGASGTAGHGAVLSTNNASSSIAFTAEL